MGPVSSVFEDDESDGGDESHAGDAESESSEQDFKSRQRAPAALPPRRHANHLSFDSGGTSASKTPIGPLDQRRRATSDRHLGQRYCYDNGRWRQRPEEQQQQCMTLSDARLQRRRFSSAAAASSSSVVGATTTSHASAASATRRAHLALNERGDRLADLGSRTDSTRHHACQLAQTSRALLHRCKQKKWYEF